MNKKWIYTLLAASLLSAAALPVLPALPQASVAMAAAAHTIELSHVSALRGQTVTATGTFEPGAWVSLRGVDSANKLVIFEAAKADAAGRYTFSVVVPTQAELGELRIATGSGEQVAEASLTVVASGSGSGSGPGSNPGPGAPAAPGTGSEQQATKPESIASGTILFKAITAVGTSGRAAAAVTVGLDAVREALAQNGGAIRIQLDAADAAEVSVSLTAEALAAVLDAGEAGTVTIDIVTPLGSYTLPTSVFDREALAASLGIPAGELGLRIDISQATASEQAAIAGALDRVGGEQAADAIDYAVSLTGGGKSVPLDPGTTYLTRTLPLDKAVEPGRATGVLYDPATGAFRFAPTTFATDSGKMTATIKRNGNSMYTVIARDVSFGDLPQGHWSKADIEQLASKLIVTGVEASRYDPAAQVTRAEFAALIVRGLGLDEADGSAFRDVPSGKWYAGAIGAAHEAGLVGGYENGEFRPERPITRQELAVLIDNALLFVGQRAGAVGTEPALTAFADASTIAPWARDAVAQAVHAGVTEGREGGKFVPGANATRAEAAVMVKRLLQHIAFID